MGPEESVARRTAFQIAEVTMHTLAASDLGVPQRVLNHSEAEICFDIPLPPPHSSTCRYFLLLFLPSTIATAMAPEEIKNTPRFSNEADDDIAVGDRDAVVLQRLGKKPVLKVCVHCVIASKNRTNTDVELRQRNFGVLSVLGLSCTILGTWEGLLE